jgi:crotonobetainyl-CoA:carnitine CoA-transferase CaiB-like acyl-CoA transferase
MMGRPELATDPKFATPEARREHQAELIPILEAWTTTRPKEELYHTFQQLHSVAGYVATVADLFTSAQFAARDFFQTLTHPHAGTAQYPGAAFTMHGTAWQHAPAPRLGEHNEEIYGGRLGYTHEELVQLRGVGVI